MNVGHGLSSARSSRYPRATSRDERLDFIRGLACISFVVAHFEAFNWLDFLFWERLGVFSGAGLFVMVSGLLVGITHREFIDRKSDPMSAERLWRRAAKLYVAYVTLIALVALVRAAHVADTTAVTSFTDRWAGITYPLYPAPGTPLLEQIKSILLLRSTPHQVQILGFYVCVLLLAPLALRQLDRGRIWLVLSASWAAYALNRAHPMMPTGAQFEYAFPLLTWQLYFFNALAVGYHARYELPLWFAKHPWQLRLVIGLAATAALASFLFAQTTDNPSFPSWSRLDLVAPGTFRAWYDAYFPKDTLGPLRVVSAASFLIVFYAILTYWWEPFRKALGWLFLPLGRNSLYVFLVHVVFIAAADQIPGYFDGVPRFDWRDIWFNTAVLAAILGALWVMVERRVLFGIIPR